MKKRFSYMALALSLVAVTALANVNMTQVPGSEKWIDKEVMAIAAKAPNLNPTVLKLSLMAYEKARKQGLSDQEIITIVDYSKPSSEKRLWVIDLKNEKVLFNTHVAHGKNSGESKSTNFSNELNSLKSSIGVFVANETYTGGKGYSLRLKGMEPGVNDNVYKRKVIFHGAAYVSEAIAKAQGKIGRSWGCMAVSFNVIKPLIETIKNKTIVFAYYPDKNWLEKSKFLNK